MRRRIHDFSEMDHFRRKNLRSFCRTNFFSFIIHVKSLPSANQVCEGYVFTPVSFCPRGGGGCMAGGACVVGGDVAGGGVHGGGHAWQEEGVHGRGGHAWWGACVAGGCACYACPPRTLRDTVGQ